MSDPLSKLDDLEKKINNKDKPIAVYNESVEVAIWNKVRAGHPSEMIIFDIQKEFSIDLSSKEFCEKLLKIQQAFDLENNPIPPKPRKIIIRSDAETSRKKEERANELLKQNFTYEDVNSALKVEYGSGINNNKLQKLKHAQNQNKIIAEPKEPKKESIEAKPKPIEVKAPKKEPKKEPKEKEFSSELKIFSEANQPVLRYEEVIANPNNKFENQRYVIEKVLNADETYQSAYLGFRMQIWTAHYLTKIMEDLMKKYCLLKAKIEAQSYKDLGEKSQLELEMSEKLRTLNRIRFGTTPIPEMEYSHLVSEDEDLTRKLLQNISKVGEVCIVDLPEKLRKLIPVLLKDGKIKEVKEGVYMMGGK
jgi:hypothetical protein